MIRPHPGFLKEDVPSTPLQCKLLIPSDDKTRSPLLSESPSVLFFTSHSHYSINSVFTFSSLRLIRACSQGCLGWSCRTLVWVLRPSLAASLPQPWSAMKVTSLGQCQLTEDGREKTERTWILDDIIEPHGCTVPGACSNSGQTIMAIIHPLMHKPVKS